MMFRLDNFSRSGDLNAANTAAANDESVESNCATQQLPQFLLLTGTLLTARHCQVTACEHVTIDCSII